MEKFWFLANGSVPAPSISDIMWISGLLNLRVGARFVACLLPSWILFERFLEIGFFVPYC